MGLNDEHGVPDRGDWVLVGALPLARGGYHGVPVLGTHYAMRRWGTPEEAMAAAARQAVLRRGGGWILNLRSGDTVRVNPMR